MIHIGLFEGIGGFSLAAHWAGWQTYATCEINPIPQRVLKYYWPEAYHHGDIKTLNYETINSELSTRFGTEWRNQPVIITGGFPCQPYSLAGKRKGKEDERHLWPEMLRIIQEVSPEWVVGENVFGLINWSGGLVFDEVQTDLEAAGYEVQPYVLPACAVNAPHRRDRVWFVAHSNMYGHELRGFREDRPEKRKRIETKEERQWIWSDTWGTFKQGTTPHPNNPGSGNGLRVDRERQKENEQQQPQPKHWEDGNERDVTDTESRQSEWMQPKQREYSEQEQGKFRGRSCKMGNGNVTDTLCNGQPGQEHRKAEPGQLAKESSPNDWQNFQTQSPVCSRNEGIPAGLDGITVHGKRGIRRLTQHQTWGKLRNESIKAYGNAIVPQVALQIFNAINQYENERTKIT